MRKFFVFVIATVFGNIAVSACPTGTGPPTVQQTVCDSLTKHGSGPDSGWVIKRQKVKGADTVIGDFVNNAIAGAFLLKGSVGAKLQPQTAVIGSQNNVVTANAIAGGTDTLAATDFVRSVVSGAACGGNCDSTGTGKLVRRTNPILKGFTDSGSANITQNISVGANATIQGDVNAGTLNTGGGLFSADGLGNIEAANAHLPVGGILLLGAATASNGAILEGNFSQPLGAFKLIGTARTYVPEFALCQDDGVGRDRFYCAYEVIDASTSDYHLKVRNNNTDAPGITILNADPHYSGVGIDLPLAKWQIKNSSSGIYDDLIFSNFLDSIIGGIGISKGDGTNDMLVGAFGKIKFSPNAHGMTPGVAPSHIAVVIDTTGDLLTSYKVCVSCNTQDANTQFTVFQPGDARTEVVSSGNAIVRTISNNTVYGSIDVTDATHATPLGLFLNGSGGPVTLGGKTTANDSLIVVGKVRSPYIQATTRLAVGNAVPTSPASTNLVEFEADSGFNVATISHGATSVQRWQRSQGTKASPTPITNGLTIGAIQAFGDTANGNNYSGAAMFSVISQGTWNGLGRGAKVQIADVDSATNTRTVGITVSNGHIILGAPGFNDPSYVAQVIGNQKVTGSLRTTAIDTFNLSANFPSATASTAACFDGSKNLGSCGGSAIVGTVSSNSIPFASGSQTLSNSNISYNSGAGTINLYPDGHVRFGPVSGSSGTFDSTVIAPKAVFSDLQLNGFEGLVLGANGSNSVVVTPSTPGDTVATKEYVDSSFGTNGSGTITLTGCTAGTTETAYWSKSGKNVNIQIPDLSCTSNSTAMTITGIPVAYWPVAATETPVLFVQDASLNGFGNATFDDITGVLTFTHSTINVITGVVTPTPTFTNTGTKGVNGFSFSAVGN